MCSLSYIHCLFLMNKKVVVPIAWVISSRNRVKDLNEWFKEIYRHWKELKDDWHDNAFITDDGSVEIETIRFLLALMFIFKLKLTQFKSMIYNIN